MDAVRRAHQLKRENLQRGDNLSASYAISNASLPSESGIPEAGTPQPIEPSRGASLTLNGQATPFSSLNGSFGGASPPEVPTRLARSGTTLWRIARSKLLPTEVNDLLESKRTIKGLTVTLQRPTSVLNDDDQPVNCWTGACVCSTLCLSQHDGIHCMALLMSKQQYPNAAGNC